MPRPADFGAGGQSQNQNFHKTAYTTGQTHSGKYQLRERPPTNFLRYVPEMGSPLRMALVEDRAVSVAASTAMVAVNAASAAAAELSRTGGGASPIHDHVSSSSSFGVRSLQQQQPPLAKWAERSVDGKWERLRITRRVVEEGHSADSLAARHGPLLPVPLRFPATYDEGIRFSRPEQTVLRNRLGSSTSMPSLTQKSLGSSGSNSRGEYQRSAASASVQAGLSPPSVAMSSSATRAAAAAAAAAAVLQKAPKGTDGPQNPLAAAGWSSRQLWEPPGSRSLVLQLGQRCNSAQASLFRSEGSGSGRRWGCHSPHSSCSSEGSTSGGGSDDSFEFTLPSTTLLSVEEQRTQYIGDRTLNMAERTLKIGGHTSGGEFPSGPGLSEVLQDGGSQADSRRSSNATILQSEQQQSSPPSVLGDLEGSGLGGPRPPSVLRYCWDRSRGRLNKASAEAFAAGPCVK